MEGFDGFATFSRQGLGPTPGPVSGRLLVEQMTGEAPLAASAPYRMERSG